ncbi:peptidase [Trametopsis cervina]|nr:peptidase [Trametopsis cervina]
MRYSLAILAFASAAASFPSQYPLTQSEELLTEYPGFDLDLSEVRLIETHENTRLYVTELEKIDLKARGINFFDVTDTPDLGATAHLRTAPHSYPAPNAPQLVKSVINRLSLDGPKSNLEKFAGFRTRHYRSDTGRQSQLWLLSKINEITNEYAPKELQAEISTIEFAHPWTQSSIITRINGSSSDDRIVILGAHQDSTNIKSPFLPAPGADDDGSGTVALLESFRALISSGSRPRRPVEFHWYAAEEAGLLGSQAIAQAYEQHDVKVYAMSQFDQSAWVKAGTREEIALVLDYTDPALTEFNGKLVEEYLDIPWAHRHCGYSCSDHASWHKARYPSTFNLEGVEGHTNPNTHSENDRYDTQPEFSFSHLLEFSKLAVAFAIELGGWEKEQ